MNFDAFEASLGEDEAPAGSSDLLRALWLDANGQWEAAHAIAQSVETAAGARLHAYLHRKEGDLPNARYWYRVAQVKVEDGSLYAEWRAIARALLS